MSLYGLPKLTGAVYEKLKAFFPTLSSVSDAKGDFSHSRARSFPFTRVFSRYARDLLKFKI